MKRIAAINDLSGFGKCSLGANIPIISAMGAQCCPLTTGVFSNQTGYPSYKNVDMTEYMTSFIDEWKKLGAHFDGILTGFIPNSRQGEIIADFIDYFKDDDTIVVVDPIMGDDGELYPCYDDESIKAVKELVKKADIITPNLTELCELCSRDYSKISTMSIEDMTAEIEQMSESLGKIVIATGIHINNDEIANAIYDKSRLTLVATKKSSGSYSGTGDILASIITAGAVNGMDIVSAVELATSFISKSIAITESKTDKYNPDGIDFEPLLHTLGGQYE